MTDALARLRTALAPILDEAGLLPGDSAGDRYCTDWSGLLRGRPVAVLRPRTPDEVAATMRVLHALRQPVVVLGGNTGLVGASVPQPGEVVLSTERLTAIEAFDGVQGSIVVQAGLPLEAVHRHVEARGWMFPVDIGSRGSCTVGGIVATNAGGNRVLRWGMTRQSVLGLEAVLADGSVVSRMGAVLKDNAGYDLKHLFVGSEGTLGVIVRARLALVPLPTSRGTAMVSLRDFGQVAALLATCRRTLGARLTSFEVLWRDYYDTVVREVRTGPPPFAEPGAYVVLVESMGDDADADRAALEQAMAEALALGDGVDAVIAHSIADAQRLWAIRESVGEAARLIRPNAVFDVSLPIERMQAWVDGIRAELAAVGVARTQVYGHLGDGNLHLVAGPLGEGAASKDAVVRRVHESVGRLGGSISGEHGVGFGKKADLALTRSATEIALMRAVKRAVDPHALLARGRIFDADPAR